MIIGRGRSIVLLLAFAVAGCKVAGDGGRNAAKNSALGNRGAVQPDTAIHGPKACDLLSAASITGVTHRPVLTGVTTNDYMGDSQCKYANPDGSPGGVMVALHEKGDIENYRKVPGSVTVADLGDAAVWNPETAQLAVRRGEAVLSISFLNPPAKQQWAVQLARISLDNLMSK